jgi:flagellar basal-body rod modification protein FlgD
MVITGDNAYVYTSQGTAAAATETKSNDDLGKDAFLQLLATQMQYQDPMNPMDNTQFISQMANFSSLEQMQNLNTTMETYISGYGSLQALGFLGTKISATQTNYNDLNNIELTEITGIVQKVDMTGSEPELILDNGKSVKLSEVKQSGLPQ